MEEMEEVEEWGGVGRSGGGGRGAGGGTGRGGGGGGGVRVGSWERWRRRERRRLLLFVAVQTRAGGESAPVGLLTLARVVAQVRCVWLRLAEPVDRLRPSRLDKNTGLLSIRLFFSADREEHFQYQTPSVLRSARRLGVADQSADWAPISYFSPTRRPAAL